MFGMAQARHRLGLALEPRPLVRPGEGPGQEHLEGDRAVEPQVPRPVDDAHAAPTQLPLHLVAGDPRQLGRRRRRGPGAARGVGRGEQRADLLLQQPQPQQPGADLRQQLGARAAGLLGAAARLEQLLQQSVHARVVDHGGPPPLRQAEVIQLLAAVGRQDRAAAGRRRHQHLIQLHSDRLLI